MDCWHGARANVGVRSLDIGILAMNRTIYIGYDPREEAAFGVCLSSLLSRMSEPIPVHKLALGELRARGLYTRPTTHKGNHLIDMLSARDDYDGAMSTEHAIARFFVPLLAKSGWVLFMDGDMLVRDDICKVFEGLDDTKAVYCVQHDHRPPTDAKMDGQIQTRYYRKNWSSFLIFNCDHPAHKCLPKIVNDIPGRDLHAFGWLEDEEIGKLDQKWNYLVGWTDARVEPAVVHFTEGLPDMPGYSNVAYADEWRAELAKIAPLAAE